MFNRRFFSTFLIIISLGITTLSGCSQPSTEVNLYSARKEALIKPLLEAFTAQSGIKVNIISSKADALLKRIESEGINSPADVLLTTDAGRLHRAKTANVLQEINSITLNKLIPAQYRDSENSWFGLSIRLRPIMILDSAIESEGSSIKSYSDLSKPIHAGKICVRSSGNIYNQSLVAAMIEHQGIEKTENWVKGLVANFARQPQGGDRDQIRAAAAGQCSIVIANTYYLAQMLADPSNTSDFEAGKKMRVIWPDQNGTGAHANISGAGVLKHSPNKENAIKLIEFLASEDAQGIYANVNYEYPVISSNELNENEILNSWGDFKIDSIALNVLGENNAAAVKLMDRAGWK